MNWTLVSTIIAACLVGMLVGATLTIAIQQQVLVVPVRTLIPTHQDVNAYIRAI